MKAKIEKYNLISLQPENDAEKALLSLWEKNEIYRSSVAYLSGEGEMGLLSFSIGMKQGGGDKPSPASKED